jgi:hypothetical protein
MTQDTPLTRFQDLLMRVLDGVASGEERQELLRHADAAQALQDHAALRERLRVAILDQVPEPFEIVGEVLHALGVDDGWTELGDALRDELALDIDLADSIMASVDEGTSTELDAALDPATLADSRELLLSAMVDGELSRDQRVALSAQLIEDPAAMDLMTDLADMGHQLRETVVGGTSRVDLSGVWAGVCDGIGIEDPEHVPGWEPVRAALQSAIADQALSPTESGALTQAILNGLPKPEPVAEPDAEQEPANSGWARILGDTKAMPAMLLAAAVLLAVVAYPQMADLFGEDPPAPVPETHAQLVEQPMQDLELAEHNDAQVESLETFGDALALPVVGEDGAPLFLMIEEGDEGATL